MTEADNHKFITDPAFNLRIVPRENTPQEQFRRGVLGAVRAAAKLYPQDVVEIVRQEVLDKRK